jgi:hypothetical protein
MPAGPKAASVWPSKVRPDVREGHFGLYGSQCP